jgi:hypothetical protein
LTARIIIVCVFSLTALTSARAAAQTPAPAPPGPYVIDVHAVTSGLPGDASFFPPAPSGTLIPSRSLGLNIGGHVYLFRLGPAHVGVGASALQALGKISAATQTGTPAVNMRVRAVAPQLSFNFGSADGWSYLSAGIGLAAVRTTTSPVEARIDEGTITTPKQVHDTGSLRSVNLGAGARWFVRGRMAFSFDVRVHKIAAGSGEMGTPATTLVAASAGLSVR